MRDIPVGNSKAFPTMYRNDHNVPLPKKIYITEKYKKAFQTMGNNFLGKGTLWSFLIRFS
jgi:hypothetical protein